MTYIHSDNTYYVCCTMFNLFAGDAGWSLWVSGACSAPCGQNGTAIATRKCRGPSECCSREENALKCALARLAKAVDAYLL